MLSNTYYEHCLKRDTNGDRVFESRNHYIYLSEFYTLCCDSTRLEMRCLAIQETETIPELKSSNYSTRS